MKTHTAQTNMESGLVICLSALCVGLLSWGILGLVTLKPFQKYEEYKYVAISGLIFTYVSWVVVYMANLKPFIDPIIIK